MKREHKFIDRHVKKRWSRARVNAQKSLRRMQGQHDAIMREIQMTPMQRITRIVVGAGLERSFQDVLFQHLSFHPEPLPEPWGMKPFCTPDDGEVLGPRGPKL